MHARGIQHPRGTRTNDRRHHHSPHENASAISGSTVSSAYHDEVMGEIKFALKNVVDILDDLLLSEKMESGLMQLHKEQVPILLMVKEVVDMFAPQSRRDQLIINVETHNNTVLGALSLQDSDVVDADRFKLAQVLRNFLSNAIKFSPPDSAITVCTSFVPHSVSSLDNLPDDNDMTMISDTPKSTNVWSYLSTALTPSWLTGARGGGGRRLLIPSGRDDVEMGNDDGSAARNSNKNKMMSGVLRVTVIDQGPGISKGKLMHDKRASIKPLITTLHNISSTVFPPQCRLILLSPSQPTLTA